MRRCSKLSSLHSYKANLQLTQQPTYSTMAISATPRSTPIRSHFAPWQSQQHRKAPACSHDACKQIRSTVEAHQERSEVSVLKLPVGKSM
eukprot:1150235-Pelagomonas_calceolata.AAC.1